MKILVLDDSEERLKAFARKYCNETVIFARHAKEAIEYIKEAKASGEMFDVIFLDHDLGGQQMTWNEEDCGMTVVSYLVESGDSTKVIVHSFNFPRAKLMIEKLPNAVYLPGAWMEK